MAGEIDQGFVNFVAESNSGLTDYFSGDLYINDPTGVKVDFLHFAATLNAYLYDSTDLKANLVGEKNINNLAGWAGDLQTFVIDVQNQTNNSNSYANVYESASRLIGDSSTSFSMGDLLADTDAYNIYNQLETSTFCGALRNYYSSGYRTRYTDFTNGMNKRMISRTVNRYTEDYFLYPVQKWPLLGESNVTKTQS